MPEETFAHSADHPLCQTCTLHTESAAPPVECSLSCSSPCKYASRSSPACATQKLVLLTALQALGRGCERNSLSTPTAGVHDNEQPPLCILPPRKSSITQRLHRLSCALFCRAHHPCALAQPPAQQLYHLCCSALCGAYHLSALAPPPAEVVFHGKLWHLMTTSHSISWTIS